MSDDEFLQNFERAREARRKADRSFELAGEKLIIRPSIGYETSTDLAAARAKYAEELRNVLDLYEKAEKIRDEEESKNGEADPERVLAALKAVTEAEAGREMKETAMLEIAEGVILSCLDHESHETWARMRSKDNKEPMTGNEMFELADWLIGKVSGIPTVAPADSSAGRTKTKARSKASSSSPEPTPTTSPSATT